MVFSDVVAVVLLLMKHACVFAGQRISSDIDVDVVLELVQLRGIFITNDSGIFLAFEN